jgi:heme A synthase
VDHHARISIHGGADHGAVVEQRQTPTDARGVAHPELVQQAGEELCVVPLAEANQRAGVLSFVYLVAYLGMGLPAVLGGVRVVHGGGLLDTAREYDIAVMILAALALLGSLLQRASATQALPPITSAR